MGALLAALRGGRRRDAGQPEQSGPSRVTEQDKAVLASRRIVSQTDLSVETHTHTQNLKNSRDKLQRYQKKVL